MSLHSLLRKLRGRRVCRGLLIIFAFLLIIQLFIAASRGGSRNRRSRKSTSGFGIDHQPEVVTPASPDGQLRPGSRTGIGQLGGMFSSEELRYIRYGEGEMGVAEDDPRYMDYIRSFVTRPATNLPRHLKDTSRKHFSQAGQSAYVDKRLGQRNDGFFLECGAVDGETLSNSLFFELERNWTGLLVEANPNYLKTLLAKNRQAYIMSGCLSPTRQPRSMTFRPAGVFGGLGESMEKTHADFVDTRSGGKSVVTVQCFPLPHVLRALGVSRVDYLSLDVEGPELEILRTLDLSAVRVDILTIEYRVITPVPRVKVDVEATQKKLDDLRRFFNETGLYREVTRLNTLDVVFERTDLYSP